ncbi:MAG: GHKL domain-containing protein [Alphaproteobacteria bacterium]|nr:GHKL domain-containing protein [Alphaproteobacteria bacterium]
MIGRLMHFYEIFKKHIFYILIIAIFIIALSNILGGNIWTLTLLNVVLGCMAFVFYRLYIEATEQKLAADAPVILPKSALDINNYIEAQVFPTLVLDANDGIIHVNQIMVQAFNDTAEIKQKDQLIGQDFSALLRLPQLLDAYDEVKANKLPKQFHFEHVYNGERQYWVNISPIALSAPKNSAEDWALTSEKDYIYVFTLRDLTMDRKTDRMRVDFVANASHELRTPLASISGFIETIQGPAKNDEKAKAEFLTIMQEQALRMTRLIDDLLSLSHIEMNIHTKPTDDVDLKQVIEHVLDSAAPLAGDKNVKLEFNNQIGGALIKGDGDQLIQLFGNLLDNAFKYGLRGDASDKIIIRLSQTGDDADAENTAQDKYLVSVIDFGHGISQTDLPRLTERFYRVSNQHATKGTGLGLAIVKHIIQRHGGEIQFRSQIDKGTKVEIAFSKSK